LSLLKYALNTQLVLGEAICRARLMGLVIAPYVYFADGG
jgi:hypothetical protein